MTQTTLITQAQAGDLTTPRLATASYAAYGRKGWHGWGTPTRITRGAPRGMPVPEPYAHWPSVGLLKPGSDYFGQGLPPDEFEALYVADLNRRGIVNIAAALRGIPLDEDEQIVLLCFEGRAKLHLCHRRMFARWWQGWTGVEVPELS